MLGIYSSLFEALNYQEIFFCNWKGIAYRERNLSGVGDLDLYVPIEHRADFEKVSSDLGFINVQSFQANHENLEHYYGWDSEAQVFVHLHVYYRVVTGESFSKNYLLALDEFFQRKTVSSVDLPALEVSAQKAVFLIRAFLKLGSVYGFFQYWRDREKYEAEWKLFDDVCEYDDIRELGVTAGDFKRLDQIYNTNNAARIFFEALRFKKSMSRFRQRGFFRHLAYKTSNFVIRLVNRFVLKRKKVFASGAIIAICGLDGSGKSSLVAALVRHYSEHFSVESLHLGRPPVSFWSAFMQPILTAYRTRGALFAKKDSTPSSEGDKEISLLYAIRSVFLAYDRRAQAERAYRLSSKGYLVICDRYPGLIEGKMDSPRIKTDESRGRIYRLLHAMEKQLYASIKPASVAINLQVPLEVSVARNNLREKANKESEEELAERFAINGGVRFRAIRQKDIDATQSFAKVFTDVSSYIWFYEIGTQHES